MYIAINSLSTTQDEYIKADCTMTKDETEAMAFNSITEGLDFFRYRVTNLPIFKEISQSELNSQRIVKKFKGKFSRPFSLGELEIILIRYKIMLEEEPDRFSISEFIEQEDFRRNIFVKN